MEKKDLGLERVIFFSDAVVAIAITLLALELRLDVEPGHHLTFDDLIIPWKTYLAFILSFINIAGIWRTHHLFFHHIKKLDEKILAINIGWLFFIVVLPFSTSLLSAHFGDIPAIFLYSLNVFCISVCLNFIWDYADFKKDFTDKTNLSPTEQTNIRLMLNLDMLNALIAVVLSFLFPKLAFFFLFFKLPIIVFISFYKARQRKRNTIADNNQPE